MCVCGGVCVGVWVWCGVCRGVGGWVGKRLSVCFFSCWHPNGSIFFSFPLFKGKCKCHLQNCLFYAVSDDFILKIVIVSFFFLEIKFQNGVHSKKKLYLTYFFHF